MKSRTIIAICASLALSMAGFVSAHDGEAEPVTKNFEATIPNIPGKSLLEAPAVFVLDTNDNQMTTSVK